MKKPLNKKEMRQIIGGRSKESYLAEYSRLAAELKEYKNNHLFVCKGDFNSDPHYQAYVNQINALLKAAKEDPESANSFVDFKIDCR